MKKRKIIWYRLILLILIALIIFIGSIAFFSSLIYKFVKEEQRCTREAYSMTVIVDDYRYELNYDEALQYMREGTLPTITTLQYEVPVVEEQEPEEPELTYLGEFRLTGYCNCEICCGKWAGGPCYNGEMPEAEWTIAVDPDVISINSYVVINGHKYKACDTGSAIIGNKIDIYCDTHQECFSDYCNGYAEVYLIVEGEYDS